MSKKENNQPINNEDVDEIQQQITDLMGPPPLNTSPLQSNPEVTQIVPIPEKLKKNKREPEKKVSSKEENTPVNNLPKDDDASIDKSMTIEQAEKVAEKSNSEMVDEKNTIDEKTDSIYSAKVLKAVDDIESREDRVYDDDQTNIKQPPIQDFGKKHKSFKQLILSKKAFKILALIIILSILFIAIFPPTRYKILNTFGVRANVSLKVIDSANQLPLKNVEVAVAGVFSKTDENGVANVSGAKLGKTNLSLTKRSFSPINEAITIGWGSNPIDTAYQMSPSGTKYSFILVDFLTNEPIADIKISDGNSTAISNKQGVAEIKIEPTEKDTYINVKSENYTSQAVKLTANPTSQNIPIKIIPAQQDVFITNRSGKYDLYARQVDGSNEVQILPGTGNENISDISILPKTLSSKVAFVSTRDGSKNKDGYLMSNLYIVDAKSKQVIKVPGTESEKIQLLSWDKDKLIYAKIVSGPSGNQEGRQRIIAYSLTEENQKELAMANEFNDITVINGVVYYATNSAQAGASKFYSVNVDGSSKKVALDKQVWVVKQINPSNLLLNTADKKWYQLSLSDGKITEYKGADTQQVGKNYITSPTGKQFAWIERRDGKDVLVVKTSDTNKQDKIIATKNGLQYPIHWINDNYFITTVSNNDESATYIVNVSASKIQKIGDQTNTAQTGRWYYF
jgi:hypothetical protein